MAQALFTDLTGNPEDARFRIAPEDDTKVSGSLVYPRVPANQAANYSQGHVYGEGKEITQEQIEDLVLSPGGTPPDALAGKRLLNGGPLQIGTVDPANPIMIHALAGVYGTYSWTDNTTDSLFRFSLEETAADGGGTVVDAFTFGENDQMVTPVRVSGMRFTGYDMAASPSGPYQIEFPFLAERYDLFGQVTQTAGGSPPSTLPVAIGTFSGNLATESLDQDIYLKIQAFDSGAGTYTLQTKISAAAAYSNTQTMPPGSWLRLDDEAGDAIGDFRDQVRVYFAASPTLVVNDEFKIPRRHTGWSSSLGTRRPISSVNTRALIDDVEIPITDLSINAAWDGVINEDEVTGAQGREIDVGGALRVTVNITRRVRDLLFQKGIHEGSEVAVVIDAQTDTEIGATGKFYRFLRVLPRCRVTGSMFRVDAGAANRNESPALVALDPTATYTYDGHNFDAHDTVLLQNTVADVTALVAS
jgi:hypothetical protein